MSKATLEVARTWREAGIAVIPVAYRGKKPLVRWKTYQTHLPEDATLERWFSGAPCNLGLVTGHRGLTVLDFDARPLFDRWCAWAQERPKAALVARLGYKVATARGVHVYLRLPQPVPTRALVDRAGRRCGIDIKGLRGYVLAPPSVHPTGAHYQPLGNGGVIFVVSALSDVLPQALLTGPAPSPPQRAPLPPPASYRGTGLVARIKAHFRVTDFVPIQRRTGDGWAMAHCPFHADRHPSMSVNLKHQWVKCLAGCTPRPLDVIALYARLNGLSNAEAIQALARQL